MSDYQKRISNGSLSWNVDPALVLRQTEKPQAKTLIKAVWGRVKRGLSPRLAEVAAHQGHRAPLGVKPRTEFSFSFRKEQRDILEEGPPRPPNHGHPG